MKEIYIQSVLLIERLHRRFLDVVKAELDRLRIDDINNVQTLILYNISGEQLTIGELTNRGYYLGSNVSYNVKKLVENGYLIQSPAPHDRRSTRIRLSDKAKVLCERIDELYSRSVDLLQRSGIQETTLQQINRQLSDLERFWTEQVNVIYKLAAGVR